MIYNKIDINNNLDIYFKELFRVLDFYKNFLQNHGIHTLRKFFNKTDELTFQFILEGILFSTFWGYNESRIGDGRIDFFLIGPETQTIVIETKLSTDPDWIDGISAQLPEYLNRKKNSFGIFILFLLDLKLKKNEIEDILKNVCDNNLNNIIHYIIIDLTERAKPSELQGYMELRQLDELGSKRLIQLLNNNISTSHQLLQQDTSKLGEKTGIPVALIEKWKSQIKDNNTQKKMSN